MASSITLVLGLLLAINMVLPTLATTHIVGDTSGWAIGADYGTWASGLTFVVGDSLVFNYGAGHTVDEVKKSDYKACNTGNSVSTDSSGATTIVLKTAGTHYFICAAPGHCAGGMKLAVTVKSKKSTTSAPSPAPSVTPSPSSSSSGKDSPPTDTTDTSSTPTTTTPTTYTTTTTSSNASSSCSPIFAILIVSWISYYVLGLV
ncbi:hypothetical protein RJT34_12022 [Clitoria ternatea]|uniref:Phytocyanin domain-containing protein n=1 Tax=Clitoria ternatea TaxID=43366 RepID=A0AAN9PK32_CLITE